MKHVQLLPGVLCKLIILGAPAHRRNDLRKDLRVRSQSLGWAGVSACWSCGELEEGRGSGRPDQQLASTRSQPNPPNRFSDPKIISRSSRGQHFPVNALDPLLTAWWGQCGKPRTSSRLAFFLLLWCSWCGCPVGVDGSTRLFFHKKHILLSDPGQVYPWRVQTL